VKIRRFVAEDMKTALAQIKEELGADAVIMSNKKIVEGVEIMAAIDYYPTQTADDNSAQEKVMQKTVATPKNSSVSREVDSDVVIFGQKTNVPQSAESDSVPVDSLSALLSRKVQQTPHVESAIKLTEKTELPSSNNSNSNIEVQFKNFTDRLEQSTQQRNNDQVAEQQNPVSGLNESNIGYENGYENKVDTPTTSLNNTTSFSNEGSPEFENMKKEMNTIRHLLEHQVSGLMWQDMAQKNPQKALLINKLVALGLTDHMADQIAGFIPPQGNDQDAWEQAKSFLTQQLNTTNNDIIHHGGVVSLVGPTGVGKTTTIAKLAARFAQIHGADEVVLISTDSFRIGGFEQLSTYGRIIGCQVKLANDAKALDSLLEQFGNKKLILIDTAGMGQRDMRLAQHLTDLIANARVRIRNYLVLSANTQQRVMQENVERFKKIPLAGCIYTKLDESISIGEIISTSIQNGLPIGYLTDGQRVPEDIKVANAEKLVILADKMCNKKNHLNTSTWRPMPKKEAAIT